jgi:hypothetical protein
MSVGGARYERGYSDDGSAAEEQTERSNGNPCTCAFIRTEGTTDDAPPVVTVVVHGLVERSEHGASCCVAYQIARAIKIS